MSAKVAYTRNVVLGMVLILLVGLLAFASSASAQIGNATLSGTVLDSTGGVVADAELTLTNKVTGFTKPFSTARPCRKAS